MCSLFSKPTAEALTEYTRKVDFLKGLLEAEKLVSGDILQIHPFIDHCYIICWITYFPLSINA